MRSRTDPTVRSDAWWRILCTECALEAESTGAFFFSQSDMLEERIGRLGSRGIKRLYQPSLRSPWDDSGWIRDQSHQYIRRFAEAKSKVTHICATHAPLTGFDAPPGVRGAA